MTRLIYVRHGQSECNLCGTFTGQKDVPLTPLGRKQADCAASYLQQFPIDSIYSSDLMRAMQTAEPTATALGLAIQPIPALREIFAGKWEGMPYESIARQYGKAFDQWRNDLGNAVCTGGESVADLAERVIAATSDLVARNRGKCIALFGHATPLRVLWCHWNNRPITDAANVPWSCNASVTVVDYDENDHPHMQQFAYCEHLGDTATILPGTV